MIKERGEFIGSLLRKLLTLELCQSENRNLLRKPLTCISLRQRIALALPVLLPRGYSSSAEKTRTRSRDLRSCSGARVEAFLLDRLDLSTAKQQIAGFSPEVDGDFGRRSMSRIVAECFSIAKSRAVRPRELSLKGSAPERRRRRTSWNHH